MGRIARPVAAGVALLVALALLAPLLLRVNRFRPTIEAELSRVLGRRVTIGALKVSLFSGGAVASDITIAEDPAFGPGPFLSAKSMRIGVELRPFLRRRKINVTALTIEQPEIALRQSLRGDWNFSGLARNTAPAAGSGRSGRIDFSIRLLKIAGANLSATLSASPNYLRLKKVDFEARDFSPDASFPFSLTGQIAGGGEVDLRGRLGPLSRADVSTTPLDARLKLAGLDLTGSGLIGAASGVAGRISFDGPLHSDGGVLQAGGRLKAGRLKLARNAAPARQEAEFDFSLAHDLRTRAGTLHPGTVRIGAAQAGLTGTYGISGGSIFVKLNFYGPNMPLPELAGMLPAVGIALPSGASFQGGAAGARLAIEGATDRLAATGALAIRNTRLAGFDLSSKMSPVVRLAGIETGPATQIRSLTSNLRIAPEGITAANIQIDVPAIGTITGAGTISPSHALNFAMRAAIRNAGGIVGILGPLGNFGNVPFFITGTAADPVFQPDVNGLANEKLKTMQDMGTEVMKHASDVFSGLVDQLTPK